MERVRTVSGSDSSTTDTCPSEQRRLGKYAMHGKHQWLSDLENGAVVIRMEIRKGDTWSRPSPSFELFQKYLPQRAEQANLHSEPSKRDLRFEICKSAMYNLLEEGILKTKKVLKKRKVRSRQVARSANEKAVVTTSEECKDQGSTASPGDTPVSTDHVEEPTGNFKYMSLSETNLFSTTLDLLKPTHPAEPLWYFGADVILVDKMETMLLREGLSMEDVIPREDVPVNEDAMSVVTFIKELIQERRKKYKVEHFIKTVVLSVWEYQQNNNDKWIHDFVDPLMERNKNFMRFWIVTVERNMQQIEFLILQVDPSNPITALNLLSERELQRCVELFLEIDDALCTGGSCALVHPLKLVKACTCTSLGQKCHPGSVYWLIKTCKAQRGLLVEESKTQKYLSFEYKGSSHSTTNVKYKANMETVGMSEQPYNNRSGDTCNKVIKMTSNLLWKLWEQALGTLMNTAYIIKGKTKVFQSSIVVEENTIRSVTLCLDIDTYELMKGFNNAEETIAWIAEQGVWCRLYVDANEYDFPEVIRQARFAYTNFCKCY